MAISPQAAKEALSHSVRSIVDHWEARIDASIGGSAPNPDGKYYFAMTELAAVVDELHKRYRAAGWNTEYTSDRDGTSFRLWPA